jgi:hypothetical protein
VMGDRSVLPRRIIYFIFLQINNTQCITLVDDAIFYIIELLFLIIYHSYVFHSSHVDEYLNYILDVLDEQG